MGKHNEQIIFVKGDKVGNVNQKMEKIGRWEETSKGEIGGPGWASSCHTIGCNE